MKWNCISKTFPSAIIILMRINTHSIYIYSSSFIEQQSQSDILLTPPTFSFVLLVHLNPPCPSHMNHYDELCRCMHMCYPPSGCVYFTIRDFNDDGMMMSKLLRQLTLFLLSLKYEMVAESLCKCKVEWQGWQGWQRDGNMDRIGQSFWIYTNIYILCVLFLVYS